MYYNDTNEYGCALHDQTGSAAVRDFDAIIARLTPDLRAAFEAERAAQQAELERYISSQRIHSISHTLKVSFCLQQRRTLHFLSVLFSSCGAKKEQAATKIQAICKSYLKKIALYSRERSLSRKLPAQ